MVDRVRKRWFVSGSCGAVVAVALIGLMGLLGGARGIATPAISGSWAWAAPVLAGLVVGGVAWAVMAEPMGSDIEPPADTGSCESCGGTVLSTWRLCPHCGELLCDSVGNGHDAEDAPSMRG